MFDLARKLQSEISRPFKITCRCGQVSILAASVITTTIAAAKAFIKQGWRWIEAEGGAMCPKSAEASGLG